MQLKEVRHILTTSCNLRCKHCYMSAGDNSCSQVSFSQDEFNRFYAYFRPDVVSATGGEPLLFQEDVLKVAKAVGNYDGAVEVVTNGLLLEEYFIDELKEVCPNVFFQISLDGCKFYHNYLRGNSEAYGGAMAAINMITTKGIRLKVRMTVSDENVDQVPSVIHILDVVNLWNDTPISLILRPVVDQGRASDNEMKASFHYKMLDRYQLLPNRITVETTDNVGKCGCGVDTIAIDPKGDIYPCTYFIDKPKHKMGNITDDFEDISENEEFKNYEGACYARFLDAKLSV